MTKVKSRRLGPSANWREEYRVGLEKAMDEAVAFVEAQNDPVVIESVGGEMRCTVCWKKESDWSDYHGYSRCA